jgi:hypothetical protein
VSCSHPDLQEVLDGLTQLSTGGQELRRVLIERARTTEGRAWFGRAAEGVTVSNLGTPLLPDPKRPKAKRQPAGDPLDPAAIGARVAAAVVEKMVAVFGPDAVVEGGSRFHDEGSGRLVAMLPGPRQLRLNEDEDTVLMQRFLDPETDEPVEGELGRWHEPEPEA